MKRFLVALIVAFSTAAFAAGESDYPKINVVEKKLSNGISVTLVDRGYAPTLALVISFKVGSADESYESCGAAHMLEHMLFKGTDRIGTKDYLKEKPLLDRINQLGATIDRMEVVNPSSPILPKMKEEMARLVEEQKNYLVLSPYSAIYSEMGGVNFNAFTSRDMTSYHIELPSTSLQTWAKVESERMENPVFRQYYTERDAVYQERMMRTESEGGSDLLEKFIATSFLAHPYRHPTIGWGSNIRRLPLEVVQKFYERNYVPSNMHITVVGKQNSAETLKVLEETFGKLEPSAAPPETLIEEPAQKGERRVSVAFKANPYIIIGWHKPGMISYDAVVGDVVSMLLTSSRTSPLNRVLVEEKKIASAVSSASDFPGERFANIFVIDAEPVSFALYNDVEREIYSQIDALKKSVKKEDIDIVVNKIKSGKVFKLGSNMGIASEINYYSTITGSWKKGPEYMANLKKVSVNDVKSFIEKYLTEENRTVGVIVPEEKR